MLASLPFLLALLFLFLVGTKKLTQLTQDRIGEQSRMDICSVKITHERENLFKNLVTTNKVLNFTKIGIYSLRGIEIFAGPTGMLLGGFGERALLAMNKSAAQWQKLSIATAMASEIANISCAKTPYSNANIYCRGSPTLATAFHRTTTLLPDVVGELEMKDQKEPISKIKCSGFHNLTSEIHISGSATLMEDNFFDRFKK